LWYKLIPTDHKKRSLIWRAEKEPRNDEVSAQRCKTCLELASLVLVDQDFHVPNQVIPTSLGLKFQKKGGKTVLSSCGNVQ